MADRTITLEKRGAPGYGFRFVFDVLKNNAYSIVGGAPSPVIISKITPGTPAAGCPELVVGDQILNIDGLDLHGQNNFQVVALIRKAQEKIVLTVRSTQVDMAKVLASPADKERRMKEEAEQKGKERLATHAAIKASSPAAARKDPVEEVVSPRKAGVPPPVRTAVPVVPHAAAHAGPAHAAPAPAHKPSVPLPAHKPAVASPPKPAAPVAAPVAAAAPVSIPEPAKAPAAASASVPVAASPAVDAHVAGTCVGRDLMCSGLQQRHLAPRGGSGRAGGQVWRRRRGRPPRSPCRRAGGWAAVR